MASPYTNSEFSGWLTPQYASFVTAYSRLHLFKLLKDDHITPHYCDTDSALVSVPTDKIE